MKIISIMILRVLSEDEEATTLSAAYHLESFGYFQRETYVNGGIGEKRGNKILTR